ncbi:unnamed protein product, partial [Iphiclides podalirius]
MASVMNPNSYVYQECIAVAGRGPSRAGPPGRLCPPQRRWANKAVDKDVRLCATSERRVSPPPPPTPLSSPRRPPGPCR